MVDATQSWVLTHRARPWLLNAERKGGKGGAGGVFGTAKLTAEWRQAFGQLCFVEHVPPLDWITVEAQQICATNRMPDVGACFPAVKAAIDGLVDGGVIPDDNRLFLRSLMFTQPVALGYDALVLRVTGQRCTVAERNAREMELQARLVRGFAKR